MMDGGVKNTSVGQAIHLNNIIANFPSVFKLERSAHLSGVVSWSGVRRDTILELLVIFNLLSHLEQMSTFLQEI
eukprot:scaffold10272_cov276-Chaetoceros_neogracile.AAC.30